MGRKSFREEIASPGLGVSPVKLSNEPLATEGEATEGPDDEVNWEEIESADIGGEPLFNWERNFAADRNEVNLYELFRL